MSSAIDPREAKARLHAGGEVAFLDVREAGQFGEGHPLFAVPCPYSRLELLAPDLVPNTGVPVLLFDAGDKVAETAARRLETIGYRDVATVRGGAPGWAAAGLTLFKGVNVPSKTLGELVEALWHPATIDAGTLKAWGEEGRPHRIFDARPPSEHTKMRVPGSRCLPNGELAHRFAATMDDDNLPVVVHCAGRTRGITGAIGLKLAGVPNPVFALENGTQGWALAGETLERGTAAALFPELDEAALAASRERARAICERWGITIVDGEQVAALRADPSRTTYLFDVRSVEEYGRGHLRGAVHAPGGQLVQASDQWIGVRRARVVLCDDTGLRAAIAAFWLRQLGFEPYVLSHEGEVSPSLRAEDRGKPRIVEGRPGEARKKDAPAFGESSALPPISPEEASDGVRDGRISVLDLRNSQTYRAGHPAGAKWTIRPRLAVLSPSSSLPRKEGASEPAPAIVLLADEPSVAELAAIDLRELGYTDVKLLAGGVTSWTAAGLPVEASPDRPSPEDAIDFLQFVHDRHDGNLDASRLYLSWEQGLVHQLDADERAEFRLEQPPPPKLHAP